MALFRRSNRRAEIQQLQEDLEIQQLETAKKLLETTSPYPEPEVDEASWSLISQAGWRYGQNKTLDLSTRESARKISRQLALQNSHMKRILRNMVMYIVGQGIAIAVEKEDNPAYDDVTEAWRRFGKKNQWVQRQKEIVLRAFRDGEVFVRVRGQREDANIRFLNPEWIQDPNGNVVDGILTDPKDVETVREYFYTPGGGTELERIPAAQVVAKKLSVDSDVKRGIPYFLSEFTRLQDYDKWLEWQLIALKVATAVVLLEKVRGGPQKATNIANAMSHETKYNAKRKQDMLQYQFKPGTKLTVTGGVEYEMLSPRLDGRIIERGGRAMLLSIAAGAGQSEPLVSADASNANFASTMVAEAPAIWNFKDWQQFFGEMFSEIYGKVMGIEEDDPFQPEFTPPQIISRDELGETKANEIKHSNSVISTQTWRQRDGLDSEQEEERIREEEAEYIAKAQERAKTIPATPTEEEPEEEED